MLAVSRPIEVIANIYLFRLSLFAPRVRQSMADASADEDYDAAEPPEAGEVAADAEMAEAEAGQPVLTLV